MSLSEIQRGQLTGRIYSTSKGFYSESTRSTHRQNLLRWFVSILKEVFLPAGYPTSVSKDYLSYQIWDTVQAFASSITNALAFSAILEGMGVGDEKASILSATFVWLIKDGVGMLGRILFAWFHGTGLDSNLKMWRFYADILNDLATSFDLLAPFFKDFLLPISCLSNLCRSIVGVAGGATRAALTQHQAIVQNVADVSAKDGSQETLVNLLALLVNIFLLHTIKRDRILVWSLYLLLTWAHLYANYRAIRSLHLRTWNWNRFVLLCEHYFRFRTIQTVEFINRREPVLREVRQKFSSRVGVQLDSSQAESLNLEQFLRYRFAISFDQRTNSFRVVLRDSCDDNDLIRCYFLLQFLINASDDAFLRSPAPIFWLDVDRLETQTIRLYEEFLFKAEQIGWDVRQAKFLTESFRYSS